MLSTTSNASFDVYGSSNTASYPNGEALHYGGGNWYPPGSGYDLAFKTYVLGASAPSLLNSLAAAVAGVGPGRSLPAKVQAIAADVAAGHTAAACGTLAAFEQEVQAQSGKDIPVATANALLADAQQIAGLLGC